MKIRILLFCLALSSASIAYAQDAPTAPPTKVNDGSSTVPELTPDERTAFDTVKAMEAAAQMRVLETKEGRAFQKARSEYEKALKAFSAAVQATPDGRAALGLKQKLDQRVKARGAGTINWATGEVTSKK